MKGVRAVLLLLGLCAAAPTPLAGQEASTILAVGRELREALPLAGGGLVLQSGRVIELAEVGEPAALRSAGRVLLSPTASVWDLVPGSPPRVFSIDAEGGRLDGFDGTSTRLSVGGSPAFRGRLDAPPPRAALTASGPEGPLGLFPEEASIALLALDRTGASALLNRWAAPSRSERFLGWGLGDRVEVRLETPYARLLGGDPSRRAFLRRGSSWYLAREEGGLVPWGAGLEAETHEVLRFDVNVPPLVADLDGDGAVDLVTVAPGEGLVLLYRGAGRPDADRLQPDQVIRCSGWPLAAWLLDVDGDARLDLGLLEVPRLDLIRQIGVLRSGILPLRFSFRRLDAAGTFSESPQLVREGRLPAAISLGADERRLSPRLPCFPFAGEGGRPALMMPDGEGAELLRLGDEGWVETGRRWPLDEDRVVLDPFVARPLDADGAGGPGLLLLLERPDSGTRRLVLVLD